MRPLVGVFLNPAGQALSCSLPKNPQFRMVIKTTATTQQVSVDPYFSSSLARTNWIKSHPGCPSPPAYVPDSVVPLTTTVRGVFLPSTGGQQPAPPSPYQSLPGGVLGTGMSSSGSAGGLPAIAWVGIGIAGVGILGGLAMAFMPKKSASSSRRSSR